MLKPAVFLDRDGVINVDKHYLVEPSDFEWIKGAKEAIKFINEKDYFVFVVTNQSGISRGYYTENDVIKLHQYINLELRKLSAIIHDFFISPYHPDGKISGYKELSHLRKPNTGMLKLACDKWPVNTNKSILIGDKSSDMQCAKNFGINGYLFKSNETDLLTFVNKLI